MLHALDRLLACGLSLSRQRTLLAGRRLLLRKVFWSDYFLNIVNCFTKYLLFRLASVLILHNCSTVYFI